MPSSHEISAPSIGKDEQIIFNADGWVITNQNDMKVLVYHSEDKSDHWVSTELPISKPFEKELTQGEVFTSFLPNGNGWILLTSSPALGLMEKTLYNTIDHGGTWSFVGELSNLEGYVTGITFKNATVGWLTAQYHGGNPFPLYQTTDSGKTWSKQEVKIPPKYKYANVFPPTFDLKNDLLGTIKIEFVNDDTKETVFYKTTDGGKHWSSF